MAFYAIRGLGWFICGAVVAPSCYVVTSQGAAERARLKTMETRIVQAHREIRSLETEFTTRASMAQIQQWNGDVLALAAPTQDQFLASETDLANLDRPMPAPDPDAAPIRLASLVVPAGAPRPTAPDAAEDERPRGTARTDTTRTPRPQRVAMVDDGLLSPDTMSEIRNAANNERLALR